ncbi:sensor histidine kinase [Streptomyces hokutonensis]|uniref:sensor histidine kinase n=1 Tax=Streptomyces hokutonensis TaxID=1306990 RepID=UPI003824376F
MNLSALRRPWKSDAAAGLVVLILALAEEASRSDPLSGLNLLLAFSTATAVGLTRRVPGAALALTVTTFVIQVLCAIPLLLVQVAETFVAFGCARWGSRTMLWLSGLAVLPVTGLTLLYVAEGGASSAIGDFGGLTFWLSKSSLDWMYVTAVTAVAVMGLPWLAGLAARFLQSARTATRSQAAAEADAAQARAERAQAQEIARLQENQARLARDVHDVVGHSLAVILAQAESAQYLPQNDATPDAINKIMQNIATSARSSLQDVRHVLTGIPASREHDARRFDDIVDGVRSGGHSIVHTEHGTPRPLPPEVQEVALRVVQEMLTNAIKHGSRGEPVHLERHWPHAAEELRIHVRNTVADRSAGTPSGGLGLAGMRSRLASVDGRLDVQERTGEHGDEFSVTAWIPVRAMAR